MKFSVRLREHWIRWDRKTGRPGRSHGGGEMTSSGHGTTNAIMNPQQIYFPALGMHMTAPIYSLS